MTAKLFVGIVFLALVICGELRALQYGAKKWVIRNWRPRLNRAATGRKWQVESIIWTATAAVALFCWCVVMAKNSQNAYIKQGPWPFFLATLLSLIFAPCYLWALKKTRRKMSAFTRRRLPSYIRRKQREAYLRRKKLIALAAKTAVLDASNAVTEVESGVQETFQETSALIRLEDSSSQSGDTAESDPYADRVLDPGDAEDLEEEFFPSVTGIIAEGVRQVMENSKAEMPAGVRELISEPETEIIPSETAKVLGLQVITTSKPRRRELQYLPVGNCRVS